jgi:hypothetical protein
MPNPLNLDKRNVEMICNLCYQKTMSIKSRDKLSQANAVELLPQRNSIDELFPFELAKEIDDFDFSLLDFDIPTFPEEAFAESGLKTQIITEDIPSELVNQIDSPDLLFPDLDIPLSPGFLQFMTEALKSSEPQSLDQPITAPLDNFDPMTTPLKNRSISVCINDPSHDISKGFYSGSSLCKSCYNKTLSRKKFDRQIELGLHCALDASHFFSAKSPLKSNPINSDPSTVEMLCNMCYLRIVRNKSMHQPNTDTSLESTAKTAKGNQEATSADQADSSHFSTIDFALPTTPSFPFFNPDSPEFDLTKW